MTLTLACDGCFVGFPAVASLIIAVAVLIGTIYMLIAANFGARQGYLILMVSLFAWMMIISAIWLFGAPGTTPGTGPRAREPQWIPFTPTSEVAKDFAKEIATFPEGWDTILLDDKKTSRVYPGKIDAHGELETLRAEITAAEARLAKKTNERATEPADWGFQPEEVTPATEDEAKLPKAKVRFLQAGNTLVFGAQIPATDKHPATTVFAYRDKGAVFLYALYFLLISILGFALHLMLLARFERKKEDEVAKLEPEPVPV